MGIKRSEKNQLVMQAIIGLIIIILIASIITFLIDIDKNKGVIPLIFILLSLYSVLVFLYNVFFNRIISYRKSKANIKIKYIFFFIINLFLSLLSIIVLWI